MSRAALPKSGFLFSWRQNDALVVAGNLERFVDWDVTGTMWFVYILFTYGMKAEAFSR